MLLLIPMYAGLLELNRSRLYKKDLNNINNKDLQHMHLVVLINILLTLEDPSLIYLIIKYKSCSAIYDLIF